MIKIPFSRGLRELNDQDSLRAGRVAHEMSSNNLPILGKIILILLVIHESFRLLY